MGNNVSRIPVRERCKENSEATSRIRLTLIDIGLSQTGVSGMLLATRLLVADGFCMTSGVSFPFAADKERAIMAYLREKEFGYRKRRLDLPENYSLYFFRLHRRFGIDVMNGADEEE